MNWLLPTPVSPIARKCLLSSLRRMRSGLIEDMESKPVSFRGSVECAACHEVGPAQGNAFARPFPSHTVIRKAGKKQTEVEANRDCDRHLQHDAEFAATVNLVLQPGTENTRRGLDKPNRDVACRIEAGGTRNRPAALHENEICPDVAPRMKERSDCADGCL